MFRDEPFGFAARGAVAFRHSANLACKTDFLKEVLDELHKTGFKKLKNERHAPLRDFTLKNPSREAYQEIAKGPPP